MDHKQDADEIWMPVPDYNNYKISNMGRLWNSIKKRITTGICNRDGYVHVKLYENKNSRTFKLHRLVAQVFIPNPENKSEVNHLGDKTDNKVSMLVWATHKENVAHSNEHIRTPYTRKVHRLDPETKEILQTYDQINDVEIDGFQRKKVSDCINKCKNRHTHGGFGWSADIENDESIIEGEIWADLSQSKDPEISKFTNYEVSDKGRIRKRNTGRLMKLKKEHGVSISCHTIKDKKYQIYRLMMFAFNIPNPNNKSDVDHINSDPGDHRLENLRWATKAENNQNEATKAKIAITKRRNKEIKENKEEKKE